MNEWLSVDFRQSSLHSTPKQAISVTSLMRKKARAIVVFGLILAHLIILPFPLHAQKLLSELQTEALLEAVRGSWTAEIGGTKIRLELDNSGKYALGKARGLYRIRNGMLVLTPETGEELLYGLSSQAKDLFTLSGGDLTQPIKFTRTLEAPGLLKSYFRFDRQKLIDKAVSIGVVLLIAFSSRLLLGIFKTISNFLIFSNWRFLKYIYSENKNRRQTLHYLFLSVLKYIIYFTAIGFILSEIGVNYTAYLASLSVVGLAIGFGSQGLVQDIVTGFFLIFEGQFDVGDMVEISGQGAWSGKWVFA